jgi:nucleoside-triphosphatase THEP1
MTKLKILVTGPPGCGKSTLIEKVVSHIHTPATGFLTREMRERGRRVGFAIHTLDGKRGVLAHQNMRGPFRVGRYGVNVEEIDRTAVPSMVPAKADEIVVIDEIGEMECFSGLFKQTLVQVLESQHQVVGSIAQRGDRFIEQIKARPDIMLILLSEQNRDSALTRILANISSLVSIRKSEIP